MTQENQPELTEVRAEHQIDRLALVQYMRSQMDGITDDLTIRQFEGGQSNPTFLDLLEAVDGVYKTIGSNSPDLLWVRAIFSEKLRGKPLRCWLVRRRLKK